MKQALNDIKVLDFTRIIAGPFCTMILKDLGAEVIKVEHPAGGDATRNMAPFTKAHESSMFIAVNWGKKSITLNLASEKGLNICKELVKRVDVLVENFSPGVMNKLGLDYAELSKVNPRLIYASISGFGHTGPRALQPAFDLMIQALGGLISVTGFPDSPPTKAGVAIGDYLGGLNAAIAILAALHHKANTGEGQMIDISMQDCVWAITAIDYASDYFLNNRIPVRLGNAYSSVGPFDIFKAKDGYVAIAVGINHEWETFLKVIGREDLAGNPRYSTGVVRFNNKKEVDAIVEAWTKTKNVREIISELENSRIPCSPVPTFDQVANDPQLLSREMIVEVEQLLSGKVKVPGSVFKLSRTPGGVSLPAPFLGEQNYEIYSGMLGYSEREIRALADEAII